MAELLMPAGRLWQRLRRQLPAGIVPAGVRRWPSLLACRGLCLHLARPWRPGTAARGHGWHAGGGRWLARQGGLVWWLSRDGCRLYVCRQR